MKRRTTINTKQQNILNFIKHTLKTNYYCPSVREIGKAVGLNSPSSVQNHLDHLEDLGYIKRTKDKKRSITVVDMSDYEETSDSISNSPTLLDPLMQNIKQVPLVGTVQAGLPISAIENYESSMALPTSLIGSSECFLLRVKGESMKDIGMYEGDLLIVRHQSTANNGDIVVARTDDDEATVKRFYKERDYIRLQPENEAFEPIIVRNCVIEGKVIGLIREHI